MAVIKRPGQTTFSALTTQNLQDVNGDALLDPAFYAYDAGTLAQPGVTIDGRNLVGGVLTDTGADDIIIGGDGDDNLNGYTGNDILYGGAGNDVVGGGKGNDVVYGDGGNDTLRGALGDDLVYGGDGDDVLDESNDISLTAKNLLVGNQGNDLILGSSGADDIQGGQGNDYLIGNLGDDIIRAGRGEDVVLGGAGNDTIYLADNGDSPDTVDRVFFNVRDGKSDGSDTVFNFAQGADKIHLVDYDNSVNLTSTTESTGISLFAGDVRDVASISGNTIVLSNGTVVTFQGLAQVYWDDFEGVTAPTFTGDIFGEGSSFAADVAGFNPANVVIEAIEPLTVAQASELLAAGYSLNNLTYTIQDYFTNIQAAQANNPALLSNADGVTAQGDELGQTMSFAAFGGDVNLTIVGNEGNDLVQAGKGDDDIVGGQGADTIQLTTKDASADDVIYTSSDDGASYSTARAEFGGSDSDYREGGQLSVSFNGEDYYYTIGQGEDSIENRDAVLSDFADWLQDTIDFDASDYVFTSDNGVVSVRTTGFGENAGQVDFDRAQMDVVGTASTYTATFGSALGGTLTEDGQLSLTFKDQSGTTHVITTDVVWVPEQPNPPIPGEPIYGGEDGLEIIGTTPPTPVPPTPGYVNLQASVEALEDALDAALGAALQSFDTDVVSDGSGGYKLNITLSNPLVDASDEVYELVDYSYSQGNQFDTDTSVDVSTTTGTNQTSEDITATATVATVAFSADRSDYVVDAKLQVTLKDGADLDEDADVISYTITQADVDATSGLPTENALAYYMGKLANAFTDTSATATATTVTLGSGEDTVTVPAIELTAVDTGSNGLEIDTTGSATGIAYAGVDYSYEMVFTSEASAYAAGNQVKVYLGDLYADVNSGSIVNGTFTYTVKANSEYNGGVFTSADKAYLVVQDLKAALATEIGSANLSPVLYVDLVGDGLKSGDTPTFDIDDRSISFTLGNPDSIGPDQPGQALGGLSAQIETQAVSNFVGGTFMSSSASFDFGTEKFDFGDVVTLRVGYMTSGAEPVSKVFGVQYVVGQTTVKIDTDGDGIFGEVGEASGVVAAAYTPNELAKLFATTLTVTADISFDGNGDYHPLLSNVFTNIDPSTITGSTFTVTPRLPLNGALLMGQTSANVQNVPAVIPSGAAVLVTQTGRDDVVAFVPGEDVSETAGLDDNTADLASPQESTVDFSAVADLFEGQTLKVTINGATYSAELAGDAATDLDTAIEALITAINAANTGVTPSGVSAATYNDDGKIVLTGSIEDKVDTGAKEGSAAYDTAISFTVSAGAETRTVIDSGLQTVAAEDGIDRDTLDGTLDVVNHFYGDEEFGTPGSNWDVVTGFQIANDRIVLDGALNDSTAVGIVNVVDTNMYASNYFNLDQFEFGVLQVDGMPGYYLTDAEEISWLLNSGFDFTAGTADETLNTSVFAVTSTTNAKQTAIWVHTQTSADDDTVSADELQLLALVNTNASDVGSFSESNLALSEPGAVEETLTINLTDDHESLDFYGVGYYLYDGNSASSYDLISEYGSVDAIPTSLVINARGGDDDVDVYSYLVNPLSSLNVDLGAGDDHLRLDLYGFEAGADVSITLGDGADSIGFGGWYGGPSFFGGNTFIRVTDFNVDDDSFFSFFPFGEGLNEVNAGNIGESTFAETIAENGTITGVDLLASLGVDALPVVQPFTEGEFIAYNGGDAFLFSFREMGEFESGISADEIQLIGVLDNVASGSLTEANFGWIV